MQEALLDAAAELFAERGISGASLASIAERAGGSRGLPFHHFGSKDSLVARLARRAQDRIGRSRLEALERADHRIEDLSALEFVLVTVDMYLKLMECPTADQRALIVMWGSTFPSGSSVEGMLEADRRSLQGWADKVNEGQRDGTIRQDVDPAAAAVMIHGLLRGVSAVLLTDSEASAMEPLRQACRDWVTGALAPASARSAPPISPHA
jgi:AcrR family transcriptional regulator